MARSTQIQSFDANVLKIVITFKISPVPFVNGPIKNKKSESPKSAAILAYGLKMRLSQEETLKLFGGLYQTVKNKPRGVDHPNIRQFMETGWTGIKFPKGLGLKERKVPLFSPPTEKLDKKKKKK